MNNHYGISKYWDSTDTNSSTTGDWGSRYVAGVREIAGNTNYVNITGSDKINPRLFFKLLKTKKFSLLQERRFKARINRLEKEAEKAIDRGQEALGDALIEKLLVECQESALYACGYKYFIEQPWVEAFEDKLKKPLRLTPLKNFAHPIPKNVAKKLKDTKDKRLFDSYLILHLADKTSKIDTAKEKEIKEKDPILFGVLRNSTRLYYVADWEDDYCDLTLDDIIDTLDIEEDDMILEKTPNL